MRHIAISLLSVSLAITALCSNAIAQDTPEQSAPPPRPTRVYLIELRELTSISVDSLAAQLRDRYGVAVEVLPKLEIEGGQLNLFRRQAAAEELIGLIRRSYPDIAATPDAAMIGLTSFEMYAVANPSAPFVLDWREDGRFAVISSAPMDSGDFRRPASPDLIRARVQKLLTRNLGLLLFGLQLNMDPSSLLFANLSSSEDVDRVGAELPL